MRVTGTDLCTRTEKQGREAVWGDQHPSLSHQDFSLPDPLLRARVVRWWSSSAGEGGSLGAHGCWDLPKLRFGRCAPLPSEALTYPLPWAPAQSLGSIHVLMHSPAVHLACWLNQICRYANKGSAVARTHPKPCFVFPGSHCEMPPRKIQECCSK